MPRSLKKAFKKTFVSAPPVKRFYDTKRWKDLRLNALQTRGGLCEHCLLFNIITPATDVDHVTPHRNNPDLFFNKDNLQLLCAECHSKKTASETRAQTTQIAKCLVKDLEVVCCPPYLDYRNHCKYPVMLDEYMIALDMYGRQGKQELMIARKIKYTRAQAGQATVITYFNNMKERNKILESFGLKECLVLIPELYLIDKDKQDEVARWIDKLQTGANDKIVRVS